MEEANEKEVTESIVKVKDVDMLDGTRKLATKGKKFDNLWKREGGESKVKKTPLPLPFID